MLQAKVTGYDTRLLAGLIRGLRRIAPVMKLLLLVARRWLKVVGRGLLLWWWLLLLLRLLLLLGLVKDLLVLTVQCSLTLQRLRLVLELLMVLLQLVGQVVRRLIQLLVVGRRVEMLARHLTDGCARVNKSRVLRRDVGVRLLRRIRVLVHLAQVVQW